jgi:PAS domain-containing protein
MIKILRKHQKKVMAFFGVGLMIAFAASSNPGRNAGGTSRQIIGKMNDGPIYNTDLAEARWEWVALSRYVTFTRHNPYTGQEELVPMVASYFPSSSITEIEQKPELFLLLKREAIDANVQINKDDVQDIMTNHYSPPAGADEDTYERVSDAVSDLLRISANFNRLASDVKVSEPMRNLELAKALQKIQLNVVELAASRYLSKVPAPTTQAAAEQFAKFATVDPGKPEKPGNPFGFGYKLPDRVKLQYLEIDRGAAEKIVEATKTPYDWDVDARIYYLQHQDEFPTTQATTASGAAATATTRPYEDVRDAALRSVRQPQVDKLVLDVQNKILATMQTDWRAWNSGSVITSLGEPYQSYAYLQKLCDAVEAQFNLRIYAASEDHDFLSATDLAALSGIGASEAGSVKFADGVMQHTATFLARTDKDSPAAMQQLMSVSEPYFDLVGNVYIYRLTDARAAEPAPSQAEVAVKIDSDLRTVEAYQMALDQAKNVMAVARASTISQAASANGLGTIETSPFSAIEPYLGDGISLSDAGQTAFVNQAFDLLTGYDPTVSGHRTEIIEIPEDAKVYVAQLERITPGWNETDFYRQAAMVTRDLRMADMRQMLQQWLGYDLVAQRTGYQAQSPKS